MRTRWLLLALPFAAGLASGCYVHHGYVEPDPVGMCLFGACLGYEAAEANHQVMVESAPPQPEFYVLRYHDNHFHGDNCGCPSRWAYGHRVYWYGGHWEYYDGRDWIAFDAPAPAPGW